jgi:hypothetical protein
MIDAAFNKAVASNTNVSTSIKVSNACSVRLKYPTAAGPPSDVLIAGLRKRFVDGPAGDLRRITALVEKNFQTIKSKLSTPPVRPPQPAHL